MLKLKLLGALGGTALLNDTTMVPSRVPALQAAPYVAALAACYAEAQEPPLQFFRGILEVVSIGTAG